MTDCCADGQNGRETDSDPNVRMFTLTTQKDELQLLLLFTKVVDLKTALYASIIYWLYVFPQIWSLKMDKIADNEKNDP